MELTFSGSPIDIHSHFNHGVEGDYNPPKFQYLQSFDLPFLKKEYDNLGIVSGAFSSYASVLGSNKIIEENEWRSIKAEENPWIFQWAVLHPNQDQSFVQVRKLLKNKKCLGIKIHPQYHEYDIEEFGDKIFSFANENEAVILMHPQKIELMPYFANKYPKMKLIIAHLGSKHHIDAIKSARNGNIYTDTSGGNSYLNNVIEHAVSEIGSEKILFGTDTYSCAFQYGRIAFARISKEDKENILFRNALKLFPGIFQD